MHLKGRDTPHIVRSKNRPIFDVRAPPLNSGRKPPFVLEFGCEVAHVISVDIRCPKLAAVRTHDYSSKIQGEPAGEAYDHPRAKLVDALLITNRLKAVNERLKILACNLVESL